MERDIVDRLRDMAGPIKPNICTEAADHIEALRAAPDDVVEIDIDDIERVIKAAKSLGKDAIKLSARDLWRMASDRRGRDEPDEEWKDD